MKTIAITMGDAAGIGPEIIASALSLRSDIASALSLRSDSASALSLRSDSAAAGEQLQDFSDCRIIVYGHPEIMQRAAALRNVKTPIDCITCCCDDVLGVKPGTIDARAGNAAYLAIRKAIEDAKNNVVDAIVTAPINKAALHQAGHIYPGHTEIFAEHCGVKNYAMMLYLGESDNLSRNRKVAIQNLAVPVGATNTAVCRLPSAVSYRGLAVVHVTLHTAMRTIFEQITVESVLAKIHLANDFMQKMLGHQRPPRIGICSLNPHAGEEGLFGDEEITTIRPAIEQALAEGLHVEGPKPADTIMLDARAGRYDAVVAMFHDQGHIALKLLNMHRTVNVTLGLPIIRTSVAHGTAFDKAWQGIADPGSLIEAIRVAKVLTESVS